MGSVRQIVFGVLPDGKSHATYSWPWIVDGNDDGILITCACAPLERTTVYRMVQDQIVLGTTEIGYTIRTFAKEYGYDAGELIQREFITNRIDPSLLERDGFSDAKRFLKIGFLDTDPYDSGMVLYYCKDCPDPIKDSPDWEAIYHSDGKSRNTFPHGLARWINIRGVDTGLNYNIPVFGSFIISYYRLYNRDKEGLV